MYAVYTLNTKANRCVVPAACNGEGPANGGWKLERRQLNFAFIGPCCGLWRVFLGLGVLVPSYGVYSEYIQVHHSMEQGALFFMARSIHDDDERRGRGYPA